MTSASPLARGWGKARDLLAQGGSIAFPPDLGEPDLVAALPDLIGSAPAELWVPHRIRTPLEGFGDNVRYRALFGGSGIENGCYVPSPLGRVASLLERGVLSPDVALVRLSPADARGYHSVGPSATLTGPLVRAARHVIAEIDPDLPRTCGDTEIHTSLVTAQVPASQPLALPSEEPFTLDDVHLRIAANVAPLVPDDAYLSVGIGKVAHAVLAKLEDHRGLRLHSGLLSDAAMRLLHSDAVDSDWLPRIGEAIGGASLMRYIDANDRLSFRSARVIHNPYVIAEYTSFVTVNTVFQVDLLGRGGSEVVGDRLKGGIGGLVDFLVGAYLSPKGVSILAVPSTTARGESRIRHRLASDAVTVPSYLVDYVVTEWGVADLRGVTRQEAADLLIGVAHPDHRSQLSTQEGGIDVSERVA